MKLSFSVFSSVLPERPTACQLGGRKCPEFRGRRLTEVHWADDTEDNPESLWNDSRLRDREDWSAPRRYLANLLETRPYELVLTMVIVSNVFVVVLETDTDAQCKDGRDPACEPNPVVAFANKFLLVLYAVELAAKLYTYQWKFWSDVWNVFDFSLVLTSLLAELLEGLFDNYSLFRILRLARLGKLLHAMAHFPALYMIVHGFLSAMVSIFWASFLLFFVLTVWSIIAVIVLHPLNLKLNEEYPHLYEGCDRCPRAFESVMQADLTFLQTLIAGDSWGKLATPLIEFYPWTVILFGLILVTVSIGICNLILAVIVENAAAAREEDGIFQTKLKQVMEARNAAELLRVCKAIDVDGSGNLSLDEIRRAYTESEEFRAVCQMMRIELSEMEPLFKIADADGSGAVEYSELIHMLVRMKSMDVRTMLMFLKQDVLDVHATVRKEVSELRKQLSDPGVSDSHQLPCSHTNSWQSRPSTMVGDVNKSRWKDGRHSTLQTETIVETPSGISAGSIEMNFDTKLVALGRVGDDEILLKPAGFWEASSPNKGDVTRPISQCEDFEVLDEDNPAIELSKRRHYHEPAARLCAKEGASNDCDACT